MDNALVGKIKTHIANGDASACIDLIDYCRHIEGIDGGKHMEASRKEIGELRRYLERAVERGGMSEGVKYYEAYRKLLLHMARYDFDAYCIYIEMDRLREERLYLPRRTMLRPIAERLQRLGDGELDILGLALPPGVGKTGIAIFFLTWLGGRRPNEGILIGSHSTGLLEKVYDEEVRIIEGGEYLWKDVFPGLGIADRDAKNLTIDIGQAKRFSTYQHRSIGTANAGVARAIQLLYCDDLCSGIEVALSPTRLGKLWEKYTVDLLQRKQGTCPELHIQTRWSVNDVMGRLEVAHSGNKRAEFYGIPALNEAGESNFDYEHGLGFSTENYEAIRGSMDEYSWRALYMNKPIEREGLLYTEEEVKWYYDLPEGEPDAIIGVCDTADSGTDFTALGIAYVYGNDYYIEDVVYNDGKPDLTDELIACKLLRHRVGACRFESNGAGGRTATEIERLVKERGGVTHITKKYTNSNKGTRIYVSSTWVKQRCFFRDKSTWEKGGEYKSFIEGMLTYSMKGKNLHDDGVDMLSMLCEYATSMIGGKVEVMERLI